MPLSSDLPAPASHASRAIVLMVLAIGCMSAMDALVKAVSPQIGTFQALWSRYAGQMLVVLVLVAPRLGRVARAAYPRLQLARSVLLLLATMFFFLGLARIGLAQATAVMVLNPVLITLGGALFLREPLGIRRLAAILIAFTGALIVIRPGADTFDPAAIFPLLGAAAFAAYALITRRVGPDEDVWTSLFYTALVGGVLLTLALPLFWVTPGLSAALLMLGIAGFGTAGQLLLIRALTMAEAGLLAPFGYSGLVFATILGAVFFAEIPSASTLLGAVVIVAAGLYVWARETRFRAS